MYICARGMMESSEYLLTVLYIFFPELSVRYKFFYLVLSHVLKALLYYTYSNLALGRKFFFLNGYKLG
jgi:hypothetical protein